MLHGISSTLHSHGKSVCLQIGQVEGDNPEEVKKQKAIKGSLNKITPEKFDKILADIIAVGYETEATESGLIDQVLPRRHPPPPPPPRMTLPQK